MARRISMTTRTELVEAIIERYRSSYLLTGSAIMPFL